MRILLVGSGAREHALAWKLEREGHAVVAAPGNPGIARHASCMPVASDDRAGLVALARGERCDLVVVGPEAPLADGLVDALAADGILAFGPTRAAARLESSKVFAKEFLARHGLPTAPFRVAATLDEAREGVAALADRASGRVVLKADGLAAGKGVLVASDPAAALAFARACLVEGRFGAAGARIVVERFLPGEERSLFFLADGERAWAFPPARDYKRLATGDAGPNTGGMGAVAPAAVAPGLAARVEREIVLPTLAGLAAEGCPFRGLLYVGLMVGPAEPGVLEFNVRFGDPETQAILPLVEGGLGEALRDCARGALRTPPTLRAGEACVGVVLAAAGYPDAPRAGDAIAGLERWPAPAAEDAEALWCFHAGTARAGDGYVARGGRVLTVVARDRDAARARERAYAGLARLALAGGQFRTDVAAEPAPVREGAA